MKKEFIQSLRILFLTCLLSSANRPGMNLFAQPVWPVNSMEIPARTGEFMADGIDTEGFWSEPIGMSLYKITGWDSESDFSGYIRTAWDMCYLYLFASVTDDMENNWDGTSDQTWSYDAVIVYIQLDTSDGPYSYFPYVQLNLERGTDSLIQYPGNANYENFIYQWENFPSDDGWRLEVAIPWTIAMPEGSDLQDFNLYSNNSIGFDVTFIDLDTCSEVNYSVCCAGAAWDMDDKEDENGDIMNGFYEDHVWDLYADVLGYVTLVGESAECNALSVAQTGESDIAFFPNPAGDMIHFNNLEPGTSLEIYTMSGIKVMDMIMVDTKSVVNISSLKNGLYTVLVNRKEAVRFVKE
jgi:hypothetical protein